MSNDFYDIELAQLLRATCDLSDIRFLSLPRGALKRAYLWKTGTSSYRWPQNLVHLQLNSFLPDNWDCWNGLIAHLPQSLRILTLAPQHLLARHSLEILPLLESSAEQVTSLHIKTARQEILPFVGMFSPFPSLTTISLPYDNLDFRDVFSTPAPEVISASLRYLHLTDERAHTGLSDCIDEPVTPKEWKLLLPKFPDLRRIEMPEGLLAIDDNADIRDFEELQMLFAETWPTEDESEVGIVVEDCSASNVPAGVRSARYVPQT